MSKQPAIMFYIGDWMKDPELRSVSFAARGLWIDMLCLMHESARRGFLQRNGKPVTAELLARMAGGSTDEVLRLLHELTTAGVCSVTSDGVIYNRRMARVAQKSALCSEAGKRGGGNPGFHKGKAAGGKGGSKGASKGSLEDESANAVAVAALKKKARAEGNGGSREGPQLVLATHAPDALTSPPGDRDAWIARIAAAHPRHEKPVETAQAIAAQIERLMQSASSEGEGRDDGSRWHDSDNPRALHDASGADAAGAARYVGPEALSADGCEADGGGLRNPYARDPGQRFVAVAAYLLERAELYRSMTDTWTEEEQRFILGSPRWFANACYAEDERQWRSKAVRRANPAAIGMQTASTDDSNACGKCGTRYRYSERLAEVRNTGKSGGYYGLFCSDACHDSDEAMARLAGKARRSS